MFDIFGELKKHIATSGRSKPSVSSPALYIMKINMLVTILACLLVTARQYIGQNINCVTQLNGVEHQAVENYCFITGTFTLPKLPEENSAHPGVGPKIIASEKFFNNFTYAEDDKIVHTYYQWVPIVLAIQSGIFFLPALLWKQFDSGIFETLICGLNVVHIDEEDAHKHIAAAAGYFKKTLTQHKAYAMKFIFVECFAFVIAISNLFITNSFLGGEFFSYGPSAIKYINTPAYDFNNPMNEIFPKVAKCTWHRYGVTGTIQTQDALCVLPLNIVNEKTYIFLWVFFIAAAAATGVNVVFHFCLLISKNGRFNYLLKMPMKPETRQRLYNVISKGNFGDWFILWNFKSSMMYFEEFVASVEEKLVQ